jgi:hypothetical protein
MNRDATKAGLVGSGSDLADPGEQDARQLDPRIAAEVVALPRFSASCHVLPHAPLHAPWTGCANVRC